MPSQCHLSLVTLWPCVNGRWHPLPEKPLPSAFDNAKLDGSYTRHISRLPPWHLAVMYLLGKRCSYVATTTGLVSAEEFEHLGSITGTNLGSYMEVRKTLEAFLGERKERAFHRHDRKGAQQVFAHCRQNACQGCANGCDKVRVLSTNQKNV